MTRLSTVLTALLGVLGLGALLAFAAGKHQPKPGPLVGFIDIQKVVDGYAKTKAVTKRLEKNAVAVKERLRQRVAALRMRQADLRNLDPNTLEFAEEARDIKKEKIKLEEDAKVKQREVEFILREHLQQVYKEIVQVAEGLARRRGMLAVFQITDADIVQGDNRQILSAIARRSTIWRDPKADITDAVLQELNK